MQPLLPTLIALAFGIAGIVKGVCGMGLPTVAVSLLGLVLPPAQAAALLILPSLATNVVQCTGPALPALLRRLWPMWVGLAMATVFSPALDDGALAAHARRLLGAVLVVYGLWGLWRPALPTVHDGTTWPGALLAALVGACTGLITSATAIFMLPMVPYLQCLRLDRDTMVQALGLSFTVATLALAVRLHDSGALGQRPALVALGLLAALAGIWIGTRLRARLSPVRFQRVLFIVFVALGFVNLGHGL